MFDALEKSRCEALGSNNYPGILKNITYKYLNEDKSKQNEEKKSKIENIMNFYSYMNFTNQKLIKVSL